MEQHSKSPKKLQQMALRVIKRNGLKHEDILPANVLLNDKLGFYNPGELPQPLTKDGTELFLKLNEVFVQLRKANRWWYTYFYTEYIFYIWRLFMSPIFVNKY